MKIKQLKRNFCLVLCLVIFLPIINSIFTAQSVPTKQVKTYALLVDQFASNSDTPGQYSCNAIELRDSLISIGWAEDSFSYLFGNYEITIPNVQAALNNTIQSVDENDVVLIFFATHGYGCLRDMLNFNNWFHDYFLDIPTNYKYLLIDACHAGEFIYPLASYESTRSFYAMGSVAPIEYGIGFIPDGEEWVYSEPEFSGIISSHFWAQALVNSSADTNSDSFVDMGEMYNFSLPIIKQIYSEVWVADPELADWVENNTGYIDDYPRPVVINSLSENISLYTDYLTANIAPINILTTQQKLGIIFGSVGAALVIVIPITVVLVIRKKRSAT